MAMFEVTLARLVAAERIRPMVLSRRRAARAARTVRLVSGAVAQRDQHLAASDVGGGQGWRMTRPAMPPVDFAVNASLAWASG